MKLTKVHAVAFIVFALLPLAVAGYSDSLDIETYWQYADAVAQGQRPYVDFNVEYPPLALAFFCLVRGVFWSHHAYVVGFIGAIAVVDLACRWAVTRCLPPSQRLGAWIFMGALSAMQLAVHLTRFDMLPVAFVVFAATRWARSPHDGSAWIWLALGTATKLFPVLLAPAALLRDRTWARRSSLAWALAGALVVGLLPLAAAWSWVGPKSLSWLAFHEKRGLHIATTYASLEILQHIGKPVSADYDFGCLQVFEPWGEVWARRAFPMTLLLLAASYASLWSRPLTQQRFWALCSALLTAMIIGNKVFSPQYLLWIVPPSAAVIFCNKAPDYPLGLALLATIGTTARLHPGEELIASGNAMQQLFLGLRTLAIVLVWVRLIQIVRAPEQPQVSTSGALS